MQGEALLVGWAGWRQMGGGGVFCTGEARQETCRRGGASWTWGLHGCLLRTQPFCPPAPEPS